MNRAKKIANYLLQSKAIKLEPSNPFTWASGWKSPIYCDNRLTLSYPETRDFIKNGFVEAIKENWEGTEYIAGVATGAIAQGVLVAQEMNLPFIYVRSTSKKHGMENLIEGRIEPGKKVVVIEDLVSTGGSSLSAVRSLKEAGFVVQGLCAIFTYGFGLAEEKFQQENCQLVTLSDYNELLSVAVEAGILSGEKIELLQEWRKDPGNWKG